MICILVFLSNGFAIGNSLETSFDLCEQVDHEESETDNDREETSEMDTDYDANLHYQNNSVFKIDSESLSIGLASLEFNVPDTPTPPPDY